MHTPAIYDLDKKMQVAMSYFLLLLLFLNGGLFVEGLEDLKECRMVSGKPGLCVPIR